MSNCKNLPELSVINEFLEYKDGVLFWRERDAKNFQKEQYAKSWNKRLSGKPAGNRNVNGYIDIRINKILYKAHRIIWFMFNPDFDISMEIDHKNQFPFDNRIDNLRPANSSQNKMNRNTRIDSVSKIKGIRWVEKRQRWEARVCGFGKNRNAYFISQEEAVKWATEKRIKMHDEFHNHGIC